MNARQRRAAYRAIKFARPFDERMKTWLQERTRPARNRVRFGGGTLTIYLPTGPVTLKGEFYSLAR